MNSDPAWSKNFIAARTQQRPEKTNTTAVSLTATTVFSAFVDNFYALDATPRPAVRVPLAHYAAAKRKRKEHRGEKGSHRGNSVAVSGRRCKVSARKLLIKITHYTGVSARIAADPGRFNYTAEPGRTTGLKQLPVNFEYKRNYDLNYS